MFLCKRLNEPICMLVTEKEKIDTYYKALLERNKAFVGIFYVGVKTTGIFCIATCSARKPKFENVAFYTHFKDALDNGYRPCKVCKPTENAQEAPEQVQLAINLVKADLKQKVTDYQLRQQNISPEVVRRWFKKNYGMTFHAFQRMFRLNHAYQELKSGKKVTDTAHNAGYESLSGFGYTYKKVLGQSPKANQAPALILISRFTTPLGPMFACATDSGLCLLEFVDRRMLETEFKDLQRLLKAKIIAGENQFIQQAKQEITEYFNGMRTQFEVPLHTPGTGFQRQVWNMLKKIPFGQTTTYQELATSIHKPKAVRAVGTANGFNRLSIIVPCHRVIGANGDLKGYGGGLERKRWLIEHERSTAEVLNS